MMIRSVGASLAGKAKRNGMTIEEFCDAAGISRSFPKRAMAGDIMPNILLFCKACAVVGRNVGGLSDWRISAETIARNIALIGINRYGSNHAASVKYGVPINALDEWRNGSKLPFLDTAVRCAGIIGMSLDELALFDIEQYGGNVEQV